MSVSGAGLLCEGTMPHDVSFRLSSGVKTVSRVELAGIPITLPDVPEPMLKVSQIGLKDIYLGLDPGQHVRWEHAKGTYTNGMLWLSVLKDDNRIPKALLSNSSLGYEVTRVLVGYALLFHDYGHLFFSHLLEEALHLINWVPQHGGIASLEYRVLWDRLTSPTEYRARLQDEVRNSLRKVHNGSGLLTKQLINDPLRYILDLAHGWSGPAYLQNIVNGPVDADKVDYLRRDQEVLGKAGYPLQTRLNFGPLVTGARSCRLPWMDEFLYEQYVNHMGFLCLTGRSALATAALWQERVFMYDRFYLAPDIRAADRIALEIVQQFLIRCVMSEEFARKVAAQEKVARQFANNPIQGLSELAISEQSGASGIDVIELKYLSVVHILTTLSECLGNNDKRDWECLEFMKDCVISLRSPSTDFVDLIKGGWSYLEKLERNEIDLRTFAVECIVGEPLHFRKRDRHKIQEIARSMQYRFGGDTLIDVVVSPNVLSLTDLRSQGVDAASRRFPGILVPKGNVTSWGIGNTELEPLTPEKVAPLGEPFGRVVVISPGRAKHARSMYVFDRLVAELRQKDLLVEETYG